jgi:hypothetical protein
MVRHGDGAYWLRARAHGQPSLAMEDAVKLSATTDSNGPFVQPIGREPVIADRGTADVRDRQLVSGPPTARRGFAWFAVGSF